MTLVTQPALSGTRRLRVLVTLGALSAFGPLSMDLYLPVLPELGRAMRTTDALAQLTMSMCMVGLALGQLLAGPISDRIGRRRPLVVGVATYAVASLLCALAPDIWSLIGLRLVQGLAGAAGLVIARAMVRDLFDGDAAARVFSLLILVSGLAPVVAPLVGGQLARFTDWRGMFVALAVIGLLLFLAALGLPETLTQDARHTGGLRATGRQFAVLVRDRAFVGYALVLSLAGCSLFVYITLSPFVLQDRYGVTAQVFSAIFAVNSLGIMAGGNLNGVLVGRFGARRMLGIGLVTGLAGALAALVGVLAGWGLPGLLPGLFVAVSSIGLVSPNANALAMSPHGERAGTASALLGVLQFLIGAVVPPLLSLGGADALSMTLAITVVSTAALVVLITALGVRSRRT
ncbi:multidrug effflux MFS transporter [Streptosporangium carneum]|uniref:Bcr/CflA family drug resistance efflux transporter n=1 Tax=Streptosporangium carneum TaxID=47481 RepID=A0A9W6MD73_9ACTN|nr:multidrug effflux MFS transporter [Streptosporangium carneum]GLK10209.1 Bcr/CflA family drug resistance efflux transporter [Streptosporangium carneum]